MAPRRLYASRGVQWLEKRTASSVKMTATVVTTVVLASFIHWIGKYQIHITWRNNMSAMLVVVVIASLLCAILGALIALGLQRGYFKRAHVQQRGWERSQEGHLQDWEHKQERQIAEAETRLG